MDLLEENILGDEISNHWYYQSKCVAVKKLLADVEFESILDIGAGSGFFSKSLLDEGDTNNALCVDISYTKEWDEKTEIGKTISYRRSCGKTNSNLVLFMDVLEHVDDDVALLKEYIDKVPVGANFLISVPAFQFLWSGHDIFLEHKRRYTLGQLTDTVTEAGLIIDKKCYFFCLLFPLVSTIRVFGNLYAKMRNISDAQSQLKRHSPMVNTLLGTICEFELPWFTKNKVAGLTIFCVAKKV